MATDQQRLILFTFILCAGVAYWFYVSLDAEPFKTWDSLLINQSSGQKRKPIELLNLSKVINYTRDYIEATNAEERLYDLKYQLNLENPLVTEQHYAYTEDKLVSGWPVANQTQCGAQLNWILARLAENANYTFLKGQLGFELTSLMDSFGRPEANTYAGIVSWLGSYERCLRTSLDGGNIKTRYCEARMKPKWWPSDDGTAPMIPAPRIRLGMCLPETCDTMSLENHRPAIELLAKFQLPELYKSGLDMMDLFCLPDERSPIRQLPLSGRIFLAVAGSWLVLILVGTIVYECGRRRKKRLADIMIHHQTKTAATSSFETSEPLDSQGSQLGWELLEALSLRCSLKALVSSTFRVQYKLGHRVRVDLGGIDFFKVLISITVVVGHSFFFANIYARNLALRIESNMNEWVRPGMSLVHAVDTFFFFTGVLATYSLMRKFTTSQLANPIVWLDFNLRRFLRVAPIFMLVYWYSRTVSPYTGAGPWWDYGVNQLTLKGRCMHESWLKSIPYLGLWDNPPVSTCIPPSWFIVSYVQLAALMPLIIYLLCRLPHMSLRFCLIGFISAASALSVGVRIYTQTTVNSEGFTIYGGFLGTLMEKFQSSGRMTAFSNLCGLSIGCLAGYLLRQYELGAIERWPKWLRSKLTIFALVAAHIIVLSSPLFRYWYYLHNWQLMTMNEVAVTHSVLHLLWPTLNALLLLPLAVNTYCHTVLVRFLSHPFWQSFNRLCLSIFLVHWELIYWMVTDYEQAAPYGFVGETLRIWALALLQSIALAFVVHLLFAAPFYRLTILVLRPLLGGAKRPADKNQPESSSNTTRNSTGDSRNGNCGTGASAETASQKENHLRLDQ